MDFALTDDHLALRDAVRRFCDGEYPAPQRGEREGDAVAAHRHAGMAELGLLGLQLDPDLGGSGLSAVEAMLVAQEQGRALANGSWLANAVLAAPLLAAGASPIQAASWLPGLAAGTLQIALACGEPDARYALADVQTTATPAAGGGWTLDGRKTLVLGGDRADLLLVVARTAGSRRDRDGLSLFAVDTVNAVDIADTARTGSAGLRVQPITLLDGRRAAQVELSAVPVAADRLIGALHGALPLVEQAVDGAIAALCADSAGALDALLALTCEHLRTRRQFGVPLAKFQALQHRIADMVIALEQLKSMACAAAMAVDAPDAGQRRRLVSAAKTLTAQLGRQCGLWAIQLHGAMGMTDECRASHYAKRLIGNGLLFGDAAHHLQRFAAASAH